MKDKAIENYLVNTIGKSLRTDDYKKVDITKFDGSTQRDALATARQLRTSLLWIDNEIKKETGSHIDVCPVRQTKIRIGDKIYNVKIGDLMSIDDTKAYRLLNKKEE